MKTIKKIINIILLAIIVIAIGYTAYTIKHKITDARIEEEVTINEIRIKIIKDAFDTTVQMQSRRLNSEELGGIFDLCIEAHKNMQLKVVKQLSIPYPKHKYYDIDKEMAKEWCIKQVKEEWKRNDYSKSFNTTKNYSNSFRSLLPTKPKDKSHKEAN
jgi:hypothetical protein